MATQYDTQMMNQVLLDQLQSPGMAKNASDALDAFTRIRIREDGFYRKIIEPQKINKEDLDRQADTDKPVFIVDKEPNSPAAISLPFASLPTNFYIRAPRYRIQFSRIMSGRATKEIDELATWKMDIRQIMSDNMIRDMLAEEDNKWLFACNTAMVGQDMITPHSGTMQWRRIFGGITRDTVQEAFKIMPSTPFHLETKIVLVNNVTIREILKWGRDEIGGDMSQDLLKNGWTETDFMNARWIITIKRDLVPDNTMYFFSDEKFIGKFLIWEDATMYLKRDPSFMLEWFVYQTIGGSIGHTGGICRADFV